MKDYKKQFRVRYIILKFTVRMSQNCNLPEEKASALRGGFGNCLLDLNCVSSIKPEPCEKCTFHQACIVQKIMYAPLKIPVPFARDKESEGYIIECQDKKTKFYQGDTFSFSITLFGDVIVYLQPVLQAFFRLGTYGLGKEKAAFEILEIKNQFGQKIFEKGSVFLKNYQFRYLDDYISHRIKKIETEDNQDEKNTDRTEWNLKIKMLTPLSLKYNGVILKEFHAGGFLNALSRRAYIMNCFEGQAEAFQRKWKDGTTWESFPEGRCVSESEIEKGKGREYLPEIEVKRSFDKYINRYSFIQQRKMSWNGIMGEFLLYGVTEEMLWYLLAGEILHVGKYTSFGFGKYFVEKIKTEMIHTE